MARQGLTAARVVADAAALADEEGLAAVTFAALAARLGVRAPSLYKHVASVEAVRSALAGLAVKELADALVDSIAGRSDGDALRAAGAAYLDYARAHPGRYPLTLRAPDPADVEHTAAAERAIAAVRATLRGIDLSPEDELHAIRGIRSALHGFAAIEAAGGFGLDLDRDVSLRWLIDTLWRGAATGHPAVTAAGDG